MYTFQRIYSSTFIICVQIPVVTVASLNLNDIFLGKPNNFSDSISGLLVFKYIVVYDQIYKKHELEYCLKQRQYKLFEFKIGLN